MLQEPPSEHLVAEHWDTEHTPTPCPALHPTSSILQCPDPVVIAPPCHHCFSPHPDPFHEGQSLGFGWLLLLWSGLVLLVVSGIFFFGGEEGKTGSENNKQVNSSTSQTMNEEKTPPHPDRSKTNTCTGKEDRATADFKQPNSSSLVGTEQRATAVLGMPTPSMEQWAHPIGSHLQELPGFKRAS